MTFAEYIGATGNIPLLEMLKSSAQRLPESIHAKLLEEVRMYTLVGGLPECVKTRVEGGSLLDVRSLQNDLIAAFEQDFSKYPQKMDAVILRDIWRGANASVGRQISYASLSREYTGTTNKKALGLLSRARLVRLSHAVASAVLPLDLDTVVRIKPYMGDIGLYQAMCGRPADEVLRERLTTGRLRSNLWRRNLPPLLARTSPSGGSEMRAMRRLKSISLSCVRGVFSQLR